MKRKGLFITGTDTGVGKTYVGTRIVALLHDHGVRVVPRKPIESGCQRAGQKLLPHDARLYFEAVHKKVRLAEICSYRFEPAISPQRAARLINQPVPLDEVAEACMTNVTDDDFLVVEGAGGFYSPLCENGSNADLATRLQLPVLLVAGDRLGCINHVLLTAEAIHNQKLLLIAVVLNQQQASTDDTMNNLEDLTALLDVPVYPFSHDETVTTDANILREILRTLPEE